MDYRLTRDPALKNIDILTLEMDADCVGIVRTCWFQLERFNKFRDSKMFPTCVETEEQCLRMVWIAISNFMMLIGEGDYRNLDVNKSTHPHMRARQAWAYALFDEFLLKEKSGLNIDALQLLMAGDLIEADIAYTLLTGKPVNEEALKPEHMQHHPITRAVLDNWPKMKAKILPFAVKKLAP